MSKPTFKIIMGLVIVAIFLNSTAVTSNSTQSDSVTTVRFVPSSLAVESGQTCTLAIVVEGVVDLLGFDIQFSWNASVLNYTDHSVKVPVETYPDGVLHEQAYELENSVNTALGTGWIAFLTLTGPSFTGSGTIVTLTFKALAELGSTQLHITNHDLAGPGGVVIPNEAVDGSVNVWRMDISIISPENKTYARNSVPLTFSLSTPASWIGYSLDGTENVTISGNTTLSELSDGVYSLVVYARDFSGHTGASSRLDFSIGQEQFESEPFPMEIVAVVLIVIGMTAVSVAYFVRFKRKKNV